MVRVRVQLRLDPLDGEFDAIVTIINRLLSITLTIMVLPAVLSDFVVVAALMAHIGDTRVVRLVPH